MKYLITILFLFSLFGCNNNRHDLATNIDLKVDNNYIKKYGVKSGIVKYKVSIISSENKKVGFEELYFKNWGNEEVLEEFFNNTKLNKQNYKLKKNKGNNSFNVDFKNKTIYKNQNSDLSQQNNSNLYTLRKIGAIKSKNVIFKGYDCEVWFFNGVEQWMYKGISLKTEMTILGVKTTKEAISADFNTMIADSKFELPKFPVKNINKLN